MVGTLALCPPDSLTSPPTSLSPPASRMTAPRCHKPEISLVIPDRLPGDFRGPVPIQRRQAIIFRLDGVAFSRSRSSAALARRGGLCGACAHLLEVAVRERLEMRHLLFEKRRAAPLPWCGTNASRRPLLSPLSPAIASSVRHPGPSRVTMVMAASRAALRERSKREGLSTGVSEGL